MRVAFTADLHVRQGDEARVRGLFAGLADEADALVLAGDITDHGRAGEAEALVRGLHEVGVPVVAVLGNHDHEAGDAADIVRMLRACGVRVLEREGVVIGGVGFAGAKGFGGGFGRGLVRGFGEGSLKTFVSESVIEAEGLRAALRSIDAPRKVAVLHYAPVVATIEGEPCEIHAFLGTSRLEQAIDEGGATLAVHGHAHHGSPMGKTEGGVPVYNVGLPVLKASGHPKPYLVLDV